MGKDRGRAVRECGMDMYTQLYLKRITDEDLLHSTGKAAQCYPSLDRRRSTRLDTLYAWPSPFAVLLKPSQHYPWICSHSHISPLGKGKDNECLKAEVTFFSFLCLIRVMITFLWEPVKSRETLLTPVLRPSPGTGSDLQQPPTLHQH